MFRKSLVQCLRYERIIKYCNQQNRFNIFPCVLTSYRFKSDINNNVIQGRINDMDWKTENEQSVLSVASSEIANSIKSFKDVKEILQFLRNNPRVDRSLYAPLFHSLLLLQQSGLTDYSNKELCQKKEIELLSRNVKKDVRFLNTNDIFLILKVIIHLGISSNSILGQHLLQMIIKNVNQLSLKQIISLNFMLNKCSSSPLIVGLNVALPVIFENTVRQQLDYESPEAICLAMKYAFNQENSSLETLQLLINAALKIKEKFSCKSAYFVLCSLLQKEVNVPNNMYLYNYMMKNITKNMDCMSFNEIRYLVNRSLDGYIFRNVLYYNEELMSKAIDYVIEKELNIGNVGRLLRSLNRVSYQCERLLDYADTLLCKIDHFEDVKTLVPFIAYLNACSNLSYRPKHWLHYEAKLVSFFETKKNESVPIVNITTNFIVMKCWVSSLIEYCFSESFLRPLLNKENNFLDYKVMLNLYQYVQTFYPGGYKKRLPPSDIIEKAIQIQSEFSVDFPVMGSLVHAFGGTEFILNGVHTRLGHFLDHLIVKRKCGTLFAINKDKDEGCSRKLIESLDIPEDSFLIGILLMNPTAYCLDGMKMRGKYKLIIHTIEALGVAVIPISKLGWANLQDFEKIPYLLNKIETRTPSFAVPKGAKLYECADE